MDFLYGNICTWCSIILIVVFIILRVRKKMAKTKMTINIILFIYGLLGSFTLPSYLLIRLSRSPRTDKDFIQWASIEFYNYTFILVSLTVVIIAIAIVALIFYKKTATEWVDVLMIFGQISLVLIAFLMGMSTINKRFDLAAFILGMGYYNALVLFGILLFDKLTRNEFCGKISN